MILQGDWIHVCYAVHDGGGFSKYVGTSMASLLENASRPVCLHLLHDAGDVHRVGHIAVVQYEVAVLKVRILVDMVNPLGVEEG